MIHYFYKLVSTVGRQKMQRRPRQRSKTEIISSILRSIGNRTGTRISQIMYETYIPHNQLKEYLSYDDPKRTNRIYHRREDI